MTLNPARLAYFTDWAKTLPPRPLPRTVTPVAGEYFLDYIARLAAANRLEFAELTGALDDTAAITIHGPLDWTRHEQERLAAAASQPLARIARLWWPDPRVYLRDPEGFRQTLRPACRRCTARHGITEPVACHLPPHRTVCRRHRLWIGPSARTHAGQLDIGPFPEILRAQRRHLALVHQHHWGHVDTAVSSATCAIHPALRADTWIPGQRRRLLQLAPGTWQQALAAVLAVSRGWPDDRPGHPVVEVAIYPDVVWLAARSLRTHSASHNGRAVTHRPAGGGLAPPSTSHLPEPPQVSTLITAQIHRDGTASEAFGGVLPLGLGTLLFDPRDHLARGAQPPGGTTPATGKALSPWG